MTLRHVLATGCLLAALTSPALAGTPPGSPVTISGLDNLTATVDDQAKQGVGKLLGIVLALGGLAMMAAGRPGIGIGGLGAGVAMAFVPNIIGTAFDATAAATFGSLAPGVQTPGLLASLAYAALYPVLLALRGLADGVLVGVVSLVWAMRRGRNCGA